MNTSSGLSELEWKLQNLEAYIALGCLHFQCALSLDHGEKESDWIELKHTGLSEDLKASIGTEATRLLQARWIRMFLHQCVPEADNSLFRVYLLPEDWGRRFIDRASRHLKVALRALLQHVDTSPEAWSGQHSTGILKNFDPWAVAENVSLYYLFNKLPSPAPISATIKNRFSRRAVEDLLDSVTFDPIDHQHDQAIWGLKSRLYPYQARSAGLMIQRESAPGLQLDPRFDVRQSPTGEPFYFGARDGSFVKEPKYYEANRGGILAETMGLGKTIICLAVILATKGHLPHIPAAYQTTSRLRERVGTLKDMTASILGRYSIPAKVEVERWEAFEGVDLKDMKRLLKQNTPYYEIPPTIPRMNRNTIVSPPRQLLMCAGTIVVVPRNLLHQWQSEIRKHLTTDALNILVVDTASKRAIPKDVPEPDEGLQWEFVSDLPSPAKLMDYDIVLFTRTRFEQEIQDGADEKGRRPGFGAPRSCNCPYIGSSSIPDCTCKGQIYKSPLMKVHWLRIIIDEGHNFSSSVSNAVLVSKRLQVERRWIVSGTPAKDLIGVEVDHETLGTELHDAEISREQAVESRREFDLDNDSTKSVKALGTLASNFLMVRPWADPTGQDRLDWEDYIYRHEHIQRKTYSGFSACFRRTLEGLIVKTRPEDVEKDIKLPAKRHRVVYLKPCWFDKMIQNMFVQVLRANAVTSERSDVDYLFHKNSVKARHSLIHNLRQSNFTWTGFSIDDVVTTLETSEKYLAKTDKKCSLEDEEALRQSCEVVSTLITSKSWKALSSAHEVGIAVTNWPSDPEDTFALSHSEEASLIGITQLLQGQSHVDQRISSDDPTEGLLAAGQAGKAKIAIMQEAKTQAKRKEDKGIEVDQMKKIGVPSSAVVASPLTSRRALAIINKPSPLKSATARTKANANQDFEDATSIEAPSEPVYKDMTQGRQASLIVPRKRKLTLSDELAELPDNSPLLGTQVIGTTSAKLSYLVTKVVQHASTSKILIFYDGDNTAFYLAQALEMLYINHRIYARTLDNPTRSAYVALFDSDPDIRVLLIDVACGALGLNLNAANIVLIVNPINRPGIEAQAIKRAHRIGQTKEVFIETLVLEGTMEEQIFKQAKSMTRQQHVEAKELEDDASIVQIIQNARILPIAPGESEGVQKFAKLDVPQRVFGRPGRDKYHHYSGKKDAKGAAKKKVKTRSSGHDVDKRRDDSPSTAGRPVTKDCELLVRPPAMNQILSSSERRTTLEPMATLSIFGGSPGR